jgi:hypothetical protein
MELGDAIHLEVEHLGVRDGVVVLSGYYDSDSS